MSLNGAPPQRILVLSGGLIHLVHQLAVLLQPEEAPDDAGAVRRAAERWQASAAGGGAARGGAPTPRDTGAPTLAAHGPAPADVAAEPGSGPLIAVLITGVLNRNPAALQALQATIEPWFALLRQQPDRRLAGLLLLRSPAELPPGPWDLLCLNNQWQANQREWLEHLDIPELLVCGDGLGLYYRCARELRALVPSLLGLPIPEPGLRVRYVLSGIQPRWHRPPLQPQAPPLAQRRRLFSLLVDSLRHSGEDDLQRCLQTWAADRPLWLCSVPNLAHQFPGGHIAPRVLHDWRRHLERHHGFRPDSDRLLLIDHPKAPPDGSFGVLQEPWLSGPLRSSLPLEVLIALLGEARPDSPIRVCGMTSALYGVRQLNGAEVIWLPLAPLWRHNPNYRRKPLEFLHRSLRLWRMAWLTRQPEPHASRATGRPRHR